MRRERFDSKLSLDGYEMKVLVLGGSGSIGASVVRALVSRRHEVSGLARSVSAAAVLSALGARSCVATSAGRMSGRTSSDPSTPSYRSRTISQPMRTPSAGI
ncbi:MAG: NmrA family NAD(P)-binding protein [Gammaproteobacteria bacterium]|nr:NmrA family NAD(P)-binding protein [Gammaproteobacteria bacterium]